MTNSRTGGALLRAWRAGENVSEQEAARRLEACRAAGRPESLELSQVEAAAFLGVSQSALSSWETDEKMPRIPLAAHIERVTHGKCPVMSWAVSGEAA